MKNGEAGPIRDVKISFFVNQYMDAPRECAEIGEMKRDEERKIPIHALFTDRILEITEGTKVTARLAVEYTLLGSERTKETDRTVQVHYRNAITWDDDRKAAAFVTAKDPQVLRFAKSSVSEIREQGPNAVNSNFRQALCLFESLRLQGASRCSGLPRRSACSSCARRLAFPTRRQQGFRTASETASEAPSWCTWGQRPPSPTPVRARA